MPWQFQTFIPAHGNLCDIVKRIDGLGLYSKCNTSVAGTRRVLSPLIGNAMFRAESCLYHASHCHKVTRSDFTYPGSVTEISVMRLGFILQTCLELR